jgi:hypothetical protein
MTQTQLIAAIQSRVHVRARARDMRQANARPRGRTNRRVPNRPVAQENFVALESLLRHPLPRLFRRLYAKIGDGGFGPGYGLLPLASVEHEYLRFRRIYSWWPGALIPVLEWGCGIFSCIDLASPTTPVLRYDPDMEEDETRRVLGSSYIAPHLLPEAASFHNWLEAWLCGRPLFELPLSGAPDTDGA